MLPEAYCCLTGDIITIRRMIRGELRPAFLAESPLHDRIRIREHTELLLVYSLFRRKMKLWSWLPSQGLEADDWQKLKPALDNPLLASWFDPFRQGLEETVGDQVHTGTSSTSNQKTMNTKQWTVTSSSRLNKGVVKQKHAVKVYGEINVQY